MQIKSRKTNLTHTITKEEWEKLQEQGLAKNYDVVNNTEVAGEKPSAPAELGLKFNDLVKTADAAFKKKDYKVAQEHYQLAKAIKSTTKIEERLAELSDLVG